ncbi:MAG: fused MFS/spermidine synthase [Betaproteobacteria bacterium]|nr:fused MFS/spermidine synthase [Betaproteobacteria bacterium]
MRNKRLQAGVHGALLALAVATLPIAPDPSWKPSGDAEPVSRIVLLLGACVGLPYLLLASTSPLIQVWFARARPGEDPYRLFALSNAASLAALVGYPFLVEPNLGSGNQVSLWSWGFAAFAVLCGVLAWITPQPQRSETIAPEKASLTALAFWLALSATGSVLLLAVTNHLTQNVASAPLLWLAPLTLYLLSFIVTFSGRSWYQPRYLWPLVLVALGAMAWLVGDHRFRLDLPLQVGVFLPALFVACLFCHGELYRLRPAPAQLTGFYLAVSAGGALGGLLVAVVAPLAFNAYYELGLGIIAAAALAALRFGTVLRWAQAAALVVVAGAAGSAVFDAIDYRKDVRLSTRSFYGVLRVKEYGTEGTPGHLRRLIHGAILHGEQYLTGELRRFITTYYAPESGIGAAIESKEAKGAVKVGVIGLGTGTIAAYGRAGDVFRFYDIDRRVMDIARTQFTFLGDSGARIELVLGDARLSLEREAPQGFDVLAVDAFAGDAIPVHLITHEALAIYLRHLKPDGIVAFHVSNRYLDLAPVAARLAAEEGASAVLVSDDPPDEDDSRRSRSDWVLISRSAAALRQPEIEEVHPEAVAERPEWRTWTDDYSNLVQILKLRKD